MKRSAHNGMSSSGTDSKKCKSAENNYAAEVLRKVSENTNLCDFTLVAERDGQR